MGSNSECCYSGGADARIHSWKIPDLNMDPYDGYGEDSSLLLSAPPLLPPCPQELLHSLSIHLCLTVHPQPRGGSIEQCVQHVTGQTG